MKSRKSLRTQSPQASALVSYSVVASAGLLATSQQGEAAIIYFDITDTTVTSPDTLSIDVTEGSVSLNGDTSAGNFYIQFEFDNPEKPELLGVGGNQSLRNDTGYLIRYDVGSFVNRTDSDWAQTAAIDFDGTGSPWLDGKDGFAGFRMTDNSSDYQYGWMQLSYTENNDAVTIYDFAYETTLNQGIETGAIPEPSSSALLLALGAGAAGLAARRRRRS